MSQDKGQKISPIKQRILQYIETLNVSKRKFYEETGISRGTLESNTGITEEVMAKFIVTHPEISPVWLLTGKGPMTTSNIPQPSDVPLATPSPMGDQGIPLLPVSAMAGALSGDVSVLEYECERYVVPAFQGADFLIPVKGSSMYPKYSSGDIVACKRVPASDLFSSGTRSMSSTPTKAHSSNASAAVPRTIPSSSFPTTPPTSSSSFAATRYAVLPWSSA